MRNNEIKEKFKPGTKIWWKTHKDEYRGTYTYNEGIVLSVIGKNIEVDIAGSRDWIYYPEVFPRVLKEIRE
jgi:hypothetical protein